MEDREVFNAEEFIGNLQRALAKHESVAREATAEMMLHIEREAKHDCPVDQSGRKPGGTLMASIRAEVDDIKIDRKGIEGTITAGGGEAADYALKQHEVPMAHSKPYAGVYASKYLENPMKRNIKKFAKHIAKKLRLLRH